MGSNHEKNQGQKSHDTLRLSVPLHILHFWLLILYKNRMSWYNSKKKKNFLSIENQAIELYGFLAFCSDLKILAWYEYCTSLLPVPRYDHALRLSCKT